VAGDARDDTLEKVNPLWKLQTINGAVYAVKEIPVRTSTISNEDST